mmetsp:Transcript_1463/g.3314  ORF Transcript_1463/g.3314 Transcript_1463/m.3314 type:complete len:1879 (+) Transcript_1463:77-5713(+)
MESEPALMIPTSFASALEAVAFARLFAPPGFVFNSAISAIRFAQQVASMTDVFQRELRLSTCGSVWVDECERPYLRPRSSAPTDFIVRYIEEIWKLEQPSLIISVVGATDNFIQSIPGLSEDRRRYMNQLRRFLRRGLVKTAQARGNTWFISKGFNSGCHKLVGEAVGQTSEYGKKVVNIAICPFGRVHNNAKYLGPNVVMQDAADEPQPGKVLLARGHTHFILYGSATGGWGAEVTFRRELEERYALKGIPLLMVVINGGVGTLNSVHQAVKDGVALLVVNGSGRLADLLALCMQQRLHEKAHIERALQRYLHEGGAALWSKHEESFYLRCLREIVCSSVQQDVYDLSQPSLEVVKRAVLGLTAMDAHPAPKLHRDLDSLLRKDAVVGKILFMERTPAAAQSTLQAPGSAQTPRGPTGTGDRPSPLQKHLEPIANGKHANRPSPLQSTSNGSLTRRHDPFVSFRTRSLRLHFPATPQGRTLRHSLLESSFRDPDPSHELREREVHFLRPSKAVTPSEITSVLLARWRLTQPKFVLSLGGGAVKEAVLGQVQCTFHAMAKVLEEIEGWCFTSAMDKTCASYVADAALNRQLPVIGFCSLSRVAGCGDLLSAHRDSDPVQIPATPGANEVALNAAHTHFVLVGGGVTVSTRKLPKMAVTEQRSFRCSPILVKAKEPDPAHGVRFNLEEHLRASFGTALVYTVVGGSIKTVYASLRAVRNAIPLLVLGGTGRAAGAMEDLWRLAHEGIDRDTCYARGEVSEGVMEKVAALGGKIVGENFPEISQDPQAIQEILEDLMEIIQDGVLYVIDVTSPNAAEAAAQALLRVAVETGVPGVTDRHSESSLKFACRTGHLELATRMLAQGERGWTPDAGSLVLALRHGHAEIAAAIVGFLSTTVGVPRTPSVGEVLGECDELGNTCIMYAAHMGLTDLLQQIESTLGDARAMALLSPSHGTDSVAVDTRELKQYIGLNTVMDLNKRNLAGDSALHFAVRSGSVSTVKWLLMRDVDPLLPPVPPPASSSRSPIRKSKNRRRVRSRGPGDDLEEGVNSPLTPREPEQEDEAEASKAPPPPPSRPSATPFLTPYHTALVMREQERLLLAESRVRRNEKGMGNIEEKVACAKTTLQRDASVALMDRVVLAFVEHEGDDSGGVEASKRVRWDRQWFALKLFARWTGAYVLFLTLVVLTAYLMAGGFENNEFHHYNTFKLALQIETGQGFTSIASREELWTWLRGPLRTAVLEAEEWAAGGLTPVASQLRSHSARDSTRLRKGPPGSDDEGGDDGVASLRGTAVLGRSRLRQVQVAGDKCSYSPAQTCYTELSTWNERTSDLSGPETISEALRWRDESETMQHGGWGAERWFSGAGYVLEFPSSNVDDGVSANTSYTAWGHLDTLYSAAWLGDGTRFVVFEGSFYNEQIRRVMYSRFSVEFLPSGSAVTKYTLSSMRWQPVSEQSAEDTLLLILQVSLAVANVHLLVVELMDIQETFKRESGTVLHRLHTYTSDGFNLWDLLLVLSFFAIAFIHIALRVEQAGRLQGGWRVSEFVDLAHAAELLQRQREAMALYVLLCFGKLVKYIQLLPTIGPALRAVFNTVNDTVIFSFIGFTLFFIYVVASAFQLAFGHDVLQFRTLEQAFFTVMMVVFGEANESARVLDKNQALHGLWFQSGMGGLFVTLLMIAGNLLLMNITIAIISKAYEKALVEYSRSSWETMLTDLQAQQLWSTLPHEPREPRPAANVKARLRQTLREVLIAVKVIDVKRNCPLQILTIDAVAREQDQEPGVHRRRSSVSLPPPSTGNSGGRNSFFPAPSGSVYEVSNCDSARAKTQCAPACGKQDQSHVEALRRTEARLERVEACLSRLAASLSSQSQQGRVGPDMASSGGRSD